MSNFIVRPCRAWTACRRALVRGASTLVVCVLGCLPVHDLSGYAGPVAEGGGSTASPPEGREAPGPVLVPSMGIETSGERANIPQATLLPSTSAGPLAPAPTGVPDADADAGARLRAKDSGTSPPQVPAVAGPACAPDESTGPNGHCYIVVSAPLASQAARSNCQSRGAGWDLTSIRSAADSTFLQSLHAEEVWVGGADVATEGTWTWVDDGFPFWQGEGLTGQAVNDAFVNWFADEPNGSTTSDCLRLLLDSSWADLECSDLRGSVCEGPPR